MYKYNFKTKELSTIFDGVTHFVSLNQLSSLSDNKKDFEIIKYKNMISLALKANTVEDFQIVKMWENGDYPAGKCRINGKLLKFSFQCDGKYIFLQPNF